MENPLHWNDVEKTIHETMVAADMDFVNNVVGASYVRRLYDALKTKGFLKDEYNDNNKKSST